MLNNTIIIIFILFFIFVGIQIYFYSKVYKKNNDIIQNIELFNNKLLHIDNKNEYILDDESIEILLEDYNKLKNNI
jgi:predicted PurR-regulated permease PerM